MDTVDDMDMNCPYLNMDPGQNIPLMSESQQPRRKASLAQTPFFHAKEAHELILKANEPPSHDSHTVEGRKFSNSMCKMKY